MMSEKPTYQGEIKVYTRYGDFSKYYTYSGKKNREEILDKISKMYGKGTYYISITPTINLKDDELED